MTKKRLKEFDAQGGGFIDPKSCGSHVWYHVGTESYCIKETGEVRSTVTGKMTLGDCHRGIKWGFAPYESSNPLKKLDSAIKFLKQAREDLVRAQAWAKKTHRKATKKPLKGAKPKLDLLDFT